MDWSYSQLSDIDAAVFARLGVFTGGFTTEAAEAVAAGADLESWDVVDAVDSLVAKSLLATDIAGDTRRFRMLETISVYALEHLAAAEVEAIRGAHLQYYLALCGHIDEEFWGGDGVEWMSAGLRELDNLRTAFETALDRDDLDAAQRIAGSEFATMVAYSSEVSQDWASRSVAGGHVGTWTAQACAMAAWGAVWQADLDRALGLYEQGRRALTAAARDTGSLARVRCAIDRYGGPNRAEAIDVIDAEIAAAEEAGDLARLALGYVFRTMLPADGSLRDEDARRMVEISAHLDSPIVAAFTATQHAGIAFLQRDDDAPAILDRGIELSSRLGFLVGELHTRTFRALLWADTGQVAAALTELNDVARRWRFAADNRAWSALREIAAIHGASGNSEVAARLLGKIGSLAFPVFANRPDPHLQRTLSETLGSTTLDALMAEGAALDEDQAFALAEHLPS